MSVNGFIINGTSQKYNYPSLDNKPDTPGGGGGVSDALKTALLQLASKVAYIDEDGQDYYQDLYDALYAGPTYSVTNNLTSVTNSNNAATVSQGGSYAATLTAASGYTISTVTVTMGGTDVTSAVYSNGTISISSATGNIVITAVATQRTATLSSIDAVFTQGTAVIYDTDSLDSLKQYLVVTAYYDDSSSETLASSAYALSGTLTAGTSTITASYSGKTDTFTVTVTHQAVTVKTVVVDGTYVNTGVYANGYDNTPSSVPEDIYSIENVEAGDVVLLITSWNSSNVLSKESRWISTAEKTLPDITIGDFTRHDTDYGELPVTVNQDYDILYIGIANSNSGAYENLCTWTRSSGF